MVNFPIDSIANLSRGILPENEQYDIILGSCAKNALRQAEPFPIDPHR
jgi:hypothetical protein